MRRADIAALPELLRPGLWVVFVGTSVGASADVREDWAKKSEEADEAYQRMLRELQRDKIDGRSSSA